MFYMSPEFIDHCLGLVEEGVEGIEKFDARRLSELENNKKGAHTDPNRLLINVPEDNGHEGAGRVQEPET